MIRFANGLWLDGRTLIIEEADSVSVDYDDFMGGQMSFHTNEPMRVRVVLPDFVVEALNGGKE